MFRARAGASRYGRRGGGVVRGGGSPPVQVGGAVRRRRLRKNINAAHPRQAGDTMMRLTPPSCPLCIARSWQAELRMVSPDLASTGKETRYGESVRSRGAADQRRCEGEGVLFEALRLEAGRHEDA